MRLRFDERERLLKLTHPPGVRQSAALAWAASQKAWIETQLDRALPPEPLVPGATIPVRGENVELCWLQGAARAPTLDQNRLACGGPEAGFARRIELFLRNLALDRLSEETSRVAAEAGVRAVSVSVGDARTRWGSCTSNGAIRYSWRLILAPDEALRYVVAHEVAHLVHLNHGPEFRALERTLYGGETAAAEALLRNVAPRLRRIGQSR
jgi:predicted metal-dependent hydrolase